eukprot:2583607-Prymnesium_polylepis.1
MQPYQSSIWGWSPSGGGAVTVKIFRGTELLASAEAQVSSKQQWRALLPPQPPSTDPLTVTATQGAKNITLNDVIFGDVWVW